MILKDKHILILKEFLQSNAGIILGYLLLAIFFTFPLILNLTHGLMGMGTDNLGGAWYFWLFKYNLIDLTKSPLSQSDLIFYPAGFNLGTGYDTLLTAFISIPLQLVFKNIILIYNIIILFNFVFSAYVTYHLVKYLINDKRISFIAGIMFGFSPYMLARGLGHINLLTTGAIPLFVLFFLKSLRDPSFKNSLFLAISFLLICLSAWQYGLFILIFIFFSIIFFLFTSKEKILNKKYLASFAIFIILSVFLVLPFAMPMISSKADNKMRAPIGSEYIVFSADVMGYLTPTPSNIIFGKFINKTHFSTFSGNVTEATVFLGLVEIIFIIDFLLKAKNNCKKVIRENSYWIFSASVFFILSLGPLLKVGGYLTPILFPYYFIYNYLPFFSFAKEPARMGIFVMLFVTIIFSIFLKTHLDKKRSKVGILLIFFALIIIAERAEIPYEIKKVKVPAFYSQISEEKNDYTILDLPSNLLYLEQPVYHFYQATHQKKIITGALGYISFDNDSYSWIKNNDFAKEGGCYTEEVKKIINLSNTTAEYSKDELIQNLKEVKVKYIIIHKDVIALLEAYGQDCGKLKSNIDKFFKDTRPVFEDDLIIVYRI